MALQTESKGDRSRTFAGTFFFSFSQWIKGSLEFSSPSDPRNLLLQQEVSVCRPFAAKSLVKCTQHLGNAIFWPFSPSSSSASPSLPLRFSSPSSLPSPLDVGCNLILGRLQVSPFPPSRRPHPDARGCKRRGIPTSLRNVKFKKI